MHELLLCVAVASLIVVSHGAFLDAYANSFVEQLTPDTFHDRVMDSKDVVLVQFYTSWSPNCKKAAPVWVEAAEHLKQQGSTTRLAIFDADAFREYARRFKIEGYPTIVTFGKFTKELPEYSLHADNGLKLEDVLEHVENEERVSQEEADKKLASIRETRKMAQAPPKSRASPRGVIEEPEHEILEAPPKRKSVKVPFTSGDEKSETAKKDLKKKKKKKKVVEDSDVKPTRPFATDDESGEKAAPRHGRERPPKFDRPHSGFDHPEMKRPSFPDTPKFDEHRFKHPEPPTFDHDLHSRRFDPEEMEKRRNQPPPPPPSPEEEERHKKMVDEHWERVRQRKAEREDRRKRGETSPHDEMHDRHEQMVADAHKRHEDHMAEVMKRHDDAMSEIRRRLDEHRERFAQHFPQHVQPAAEDEIKPAVMEDAGSSDSQPEPIQENGAM